jgi:hypothetical protein
MPSEEELAAAIAVAEEVHAMIVDIADLKKRVAALEQPHDGTVAMPHPDVDAELET